MKSKRFKLIGILLIISSLMLLLIGCNNSLSNEDEDYVDTDGVVIKGNITTNNINSLSNSSNNTASQISKVAVIYSEDYEIADVTDNEFAIDMKKKPGGIAFLDENENYIGYLSLEEGLDSFPAQAVNSESNVIDLGEIDFENGEGTPENNPIGDEIDISNSDLSALKGTESFFAVIAKSPEVLELLAKEDQHVNFRLTYFAAHNFFDKQGKIDISDVNLEIKIHRLLVGFNPQNENYKELELTYPENTRTLAISDYQYLFDKDPKEATAESVNFPSVGEEDRVHKPNIDDGKRIGKPIPIPGKYNLTDHNNIDISFEIPDLKTTALNNLIVPLPEISLYEEDGKKKIESISWKYVTNGGEIIEEPSNILKSIGLSIKSRNDKEMTGDYKQDEKYGMKINDQHIIDLKNKNIYWEDVKVVDISYEDNYRIQYMIPFSHPSQSFESQ